MASFKSESVKNKIVGTWKLVRWVYHDQKGNEVHYFGEDATGILMYDAHGYMNAQLMKSNRNKFNSSSINGGTCEETKEAFDSYIAYFGKYDEVSPGEIIHRVEGSLFPNWHEDNQVRYAKLEGDYLILSTLPMHINGSDIVFHVTWERLV